MRASDPEERVAIVTGRGLGGGIRTTLTLAGAAVANDAASVITGQTI